jgi:hypothetical protein
VPGCKCPSPDFDKGDRRLAAAWIFVDSMATIFGECLRVLKPGGLAAIWSLPRTSHWTGMAIELAGFEIENCMYHIFGQGLPKGLNIALQFEKRLCQRVEKEWRYLDTGEEMCRRPPFRNADANRWAGWNTGLKPAVECWWLARKPVTEGNIAGNVLRWGVGGLNVDACRVRIGMDMDNPMGNAERYKSKIGEIGLEITANGRNSCEASEAESGRWPSNLVLSHSPECQNLGVRRVRSRSGSVPADAPSAPALHTYGEYKRQAFNRHGDADGYELVAEWECVEWCPVRLLDEQSGYSETRRSSKPSNCGGNTWGGTFQTNRGPRGHTDAGGASRYFTVLEPDAPGPIPVLAPFCYARKASQRERNGGCDVSEAREQKVGEEGDNRFDRCAQCGGIILQNPSRPSACKCEQPVRRGNVVGGNHHPCVKPLSLMKFLLSLCVPPGGTVLDPFAGSGSTGVAALKGGWSFVGIERDPGYFEISLARLRHALIEPLSDSKRAKRSADADHWAGWVQSSFSDGQEAEQRGQKHN